MALLSRISVYALALLSIAAGIPKLLQMPQELVLLSSLGLSGLLVSALGVLQIAGGALFVFSRYYVVGAVLVAAAFLLSSIALFVTGNFPFGLFSLLPIFVLVFIVCTGRGNNESNLA